MSRTVSPPTPQEGAALGRSAGRGSTDVVALIDQQRLLLADGRARLVADSLERLLDDDALDDDHRCRALTLLIDAHLACGGIAAAEQAGHRLAVTPERTAEARLHRQSGLGEIAAATQRHHDAAGFFAHAEVAAEEWGDEGSRPGSQPAWRAGLALSLLRTGDGRRARVVAEQQHLIALADGRPEELALALRTLATVVADGRSIDRLRSALQILGALAGAGRLRAQIQTDLAALLTLRGTGVEPTDAVEAVALLRDAEEFAGRFALWPLLARTRRVLDRLEEPPSRIDPATLSVLTAGERRSALLAVEGLTNREAATALGVSVKAVEGHLSRAYRKLGVTSRTQLAALLRGPRR